MWKRLSALATVIGLAGVAIGIGALTGYAATNLTAGNINIVPKPSPSPEPGNLTVAGSITSGGTLIVNNGNVAGGTVTSGGFWWNSLKLGDPNGPVELRSNAIGFGGDALDFGGGNDTINFGPEAANIQFEWNGIFNPIWTDDYLAYTPGTSTTDDLFSIRSDNVLIHANAGDVIIDLGS